ncbi:MAG: hypothetical protein DRP96_00625 [Candidatus Neomarinimicrobiota bacterium]|nr:MAG: hypothetical protein DRP96_00625 [Candidatus Neomarinimicrobiota bacterium]
MIKYGISFLVIFFLSLNALADDANSVRSRQIGDDWFGVDKLKHLSSSFMITTTAYYFQANVGNVSSLNSRRNAGMVTISLGLSKEMFDRKKPNGFFSWRDLTADVMGVGLALFFIQRVEG